MHDHVAPNDQPAANDEFDELRSAVAALSERLAGFERAATTGPARAVATVPARTATPPAGAGDPPIGRRQLLRRMGYAAAGAATVGVLAGQSQAGAATGGNFILGATNTANAYTQLEAGGFALVDTTDGTYPLWIGKSNVAHIKLAGDVDTSTASAVRGVITQDSEHVYYGNGTNWRSFGGVGCAGALYLLAAPVRAYDSRNSGGLLAVNADRTVSLTSAIPAGATAAIINLTSTGYSGIGLFAVFSASVPYPGNSTLNYSLGDATATSATTAVSSARTIKIRCQGVTAHAVVDVVGYYL